MNYFQKSLRYWDREMSGPKLMPNTVISTSKHTIALANANKESFLAGLSEYSTYLTTLPSPSSFSGPTLVEIMSSFQDPLCHHFHHEIATIASFFDLTSSPPPGSKQADEAAAIFKAWGKKTVMKAGTFDVVPFFLMNLDATYEEGMWANWPPMPAAVRWGMVNVAGSVHWGWWKFASCDGWGAPRGLYALGDTEK